MIFYLEVLERYMGGEEVVKQDWSEIWSRVGSVTPAEWGDLRARLRTTYDRLSQTLRTMEDWSGEDVIGDAIALIAHTAYHLGEIRQALCTLLDVRDMAVRDQRVWISQQHGPDVLLAALSDGYITTAGWFLDLVARWIALGLFFREVRYRNISL